MSTKSYLLGSVEFSLDQLKSVSQFYETVKTYNASRELVPKKGEDGKELKKLKLNFSIFEEGNYGKNVSFTIPQTKEQRENKEKKRYVANGKIYYASDDLQGFVQKSEQVTEKASAPPVEEDLPF